MKRLRKPSHWRAAGLCAALILSGASIGVQKDYPDRARIEVVRTSAAKADVSRRIVSFSREHTQYELTEISYSGYKDLAEAVALDREGNPWFLSSWGNSEITIDPRTLQIADFRLPKGCEPHTLAIDRNGAHWIASWEADGLFEIHPEKGFGVLHKPSTSGFINFVAADNKSNTVWFTMPGNNLIGQFRQTGESSLYTIPTFDAGSGRLAVDSKGNIWFPELYANKLARLDVTNHKVTEYPLPTANALPVFAFVDSNDSVWVSEHQADKIARFAAGRFVEYTLPNKNSGATAIAEAPDGSIWFAEGGWHGSANSNRIGKLDLRTNVISELIMPTPNSQPSAIAIDAAYRVWMVESGTRKIGMLRTWSGANAHAR